MSEPKRGLTYRDINHTYTLDGERVPSVTSILSVLDKPAIPKWAAKVVAEYVADKPDVVATLRGLGRNAMVYTLKELPWEKRDTAATRGNVLHDYAEQLLHGEEVDVAEEHVPVMESALQFMEDWRIKPLLVEFPCASREHKWAGTGDLIAEFVSPFTNDAGIGYFDWKSAKRLYPDHALQFAPYTHGEFWGLGGDEKPIPKCVAAFGVHITPDGYEVSQFKHGPHVYEEFLVIRRAFDIVKRVRGDWRRPGSGYMGEVSA